jgi:hypothetical protein
MVCKYKLWYNNIIYNNMKFNIWKLIFLRPIILIEKPKHVYGYTHKPVDFWHSQQGSNVRQFFENFAKKKNFDPLIAENWYGVSRHEIMATKVKKQRE